MSTTFGVLIPEDKSSDGKGHIIEVAFRTSTFIWTNELAILLPDNTIVIPIDNSEQGIFTIGDIRKSVNEYNVQNP